MPETPKDLTEEDLIEMFAAKGYMCTIDVLYFLTWVRPDLVQKLLDTLPTRKSELPYHITPQFLADVLGEWITCGRKGIGYVRRLLIKSMKAIDPTYDDATLGKIADGVLRAKGWM